MKNSLIWLVAALILSFTVIGVLYFRARAKKQPVSKEHAIAITQEDIACGSRWLDASQYEIIAELLPEGWHIWYMSKDKNIRGGGAPAYVIDAQTGEIISKHYQR